MTEENKPGTTQSPAQGHAQLDVPEPPPPADIGGNDYLAYSELPETRDAFVHFNSADNIKNGSPR